MISAPDCNCETVFATLLLLPDMDTTDPKETVAAPRQAAATPVSAAMSALDHLAVADEAAAAAAQPRYASSRNLPDALSTEGKAAGSDSYGMQPVYPVQVQNFSPSAIMQGE